MEKVEITGGARIGTENATWPFATLCVSKDKLELNVSFIGNFTFQPKDIISIEPYMMIPFFGQGIKINHSIAGYDNKVIFWTSKDPLKIINQIRQAGFLENMNRQIPDRDTSIIQQQQLTGGFPIKKSVVIGAIVLWNVLFIADLIHFFASDKKGLPLGNGAAIAATMLFVISILSLISTDFRRLILKKGKSIEDINKLLYFLILISGFMLTGILLLET